MHIITGIHPTFLLSEDLLDKLPKRIASLRKTTGLTQATVAERMGISKGRYNHYERGIRRFPIALIPKLVEVLECSEADLLGTEAPSGKRGPKSAWEKRLAAIRQLPSDKQREIQNVVDALISKAS